MIKKVVRKKDQTWFLVDLSLGRRARVRRSFKTYEEALEHEIALKETRKKRNFDETILTSLSKAKSLKLPKNYLSNRSRKSQYRQLIHKAIDRDIMCALTYDQYVEIRNEPCYYCKKAFVGSGFGVDRLLNNLGYILGNVVSCCGTCNFVKGATHTPEETAVMIKARDEYRQLYC